MSKLKNNNFYQMDLQIMSDVSDFEILTYLILSPVFCVLALFVLVLHT